MWSNIVEDMREKLDNFDKRPHFMNNSFYLSSYVCPVCEMNMYKTVFPPGREYTIKTIDGEYNIKRVFVCPKDKKLFAPKHGYKLAANNGYKLKTDRNQFNRIIKDMTIRGSTKGRVDL